ncbi:acyl-CoA dehydrogenase family protein [Priestia megaterium]|uniref:acyl-CoA dehydrogenase family protein n=1 Tax=Priestia megaterium TaxID=1404 RepID=UPI0012D8F1BB|nr:acyl-CoA dehydrogenase family protein [Priestia megaterium]MUL34443.1 Glutaryl-CoA dehydrogenase [Priestia megaterium]
MSINTSTSVKDRIDIFITNNLKPHIEKWEADRYTPYHLIGELGRENILLDCSKGDKSLPNKLYLAQSIGSLSLGISSTVLNTLNIPLYLLNKHASNSLLQRYLESYLKGSVIGAIAITEPQGGSNFINETETKLTMLDDKIVLNGQKHFILNLPGADFVIVLAKSRDHGLLSHTLILVPTNLTGVKIDKINTNGLHTASFGMVTFKDVIISKENIIGRLHRGLTYLDSALNEERLVGTFALMSMAERVLKDTYKYINSRPMFDSKLSQLQVVRHRMVELSADYEVAKAFLEEVAEIWIKTKDKESSTKIAMAKLICTKAALKIVNDCLQMYGGRGFLKDFNISRVYRDILGVSSFAGTLEMMKEIIANRKI